jgi:hypothetical protein
MNEKRSTYRSGRIRGRIAVVFCLMLAAVLLPLSAFGLAAPRTISDVSATYLNSASIKLSATGANATFFQLDTGSKTAGTSVTTGVYGPHVLAFWSTNASGAVEATCKAPFFVDEDVPPTVVCDAVGSYVDKASITMTATDNFDGSGVDFVCYRVDGGAYQTALSPASVAATKLLVARLAKVDIAPTSMAPVDPTLPPPHADRGACSSCHDLIGTTPEPTTTPGPVVTLSPSVTVTGIGAHTLEYWAQDIARNATAHVTKSFVIVAAAPSAPTATSVSLKLTASSLKKGQYVGCSSVLSGGVPAGTVVRYEVKKPGSKSYVLLYARATNSAGATSYRFKTAARGTYYFRVRFLGTAGFTGSTSAARKLAVK